MAFEVRIPALGESVTEGTIVRWAKGDGESVAKDEILLELETDKASMEIPAEEAGILHIVKQEGETVSVGDVVARIEPDGTAARPSSPGEPSAGAASRTKPASAPTLGAAGRSPESVPTGAAAGRSPDAPAGRSADAAPARPPAPGPPPAVAAVPPTRTESVRPGPGPVAAPNLEAASEQDSAAGPAGRGVGPLSPAVRRLIDEHGLDPARIPASGKGGRLTKDDVLAHLAATAPAPSRAAPRASAAAPEGAALRPAAAASPAAAPRPPTVTAGDDGEERVPMSRIRKRIAERLVEAQRTAAILTTFNEIDMSAVLALRAAHKERFHATHGIGLGFMSFFARACISALADLPIVNAEIRGDEIVYKRFVHLGVAVGTPRGLVVPVVRHADRMSFAELEREIARLAGLARDGKLAIDDLAGGTFTISNGGVYGSLLSTPILNPPQSAILGMHKIEKRPVVVGDQIVVRPMMYVALSYDHRLVDGEHAVTFLVHVKERLEEPARLLLGV